MQSELELDALRDRAKRAYELGRLRGAAQGALLLSLCAACVALLLDERDAWHKLPLTFVVWFGVHYWGRMLLHGGRLGLVAGFATSLLPLSWLRPCCAPGAMASGEVCTMPGMCVVGGAVIGLALATFMPRSNRLEVALGMSLGVLSLVWLKCSLLFWGETLGLVGGLLAGIIAVTLAQTRPLQA